VYQKGGLTPVPTIGILPWACLSKSRVHKEVVPGTVRSGLLGSAAIRNIKSMEFRWTLTQPY
jgi:hypothetical protein